MIEIKFRAIHKSGGDMVDHKEVCRLLYNSACNTFSTIQEYHVMQFTGLADRNGTQIFEGDIIGIDQFGNGYISTRFLVKWNKSTAKFQAFEYMLDSIASDKLSTVGLDFNYRGLIKDCELSVIGNIYQNPELLSGKEVGNE